MDQLRLGHQHVSRPYQHAFRNQFTQHHVLAWLYRRYHIPDALESIECRGRPGKHENRLVEFLGTKQYPYQSQRLPGPRLDSTFRFFPALNPGVPFYAATFLSRNRITLSPCFIIFRSRHTAGISSVSRFVWPSTNSPPGASNRGKFGSSKICCASEVER